MIFMVTSHLQRSQSWKNGKGLLLYPVPKPVLLHVLCPRPHHSLPESFYEYTFAQVWMGGGGSLEMYPHRELSIYVLWLQLITGWTLGPSVVPAMLTVPG